MLPISQEVKLSIFDLLGREVQTLVDEKMKAGFHELELDAQKLASGIYLYRLESENFAKTRKMILLK